MTDSSQLEAAIEQSVARLRERLGEAPEGAVLLGSGLYRMMSELREPALVPYADLGFRPLVTHQGRDFVGVGRLGPQRLALLGGRLHLYEGHPISDVVLPIFALAAWGVKRLVLTSAVGAINPGLAPGSVVRITDHINLMGRNPLVGLTLPRFRSDPFIDLSGAYDRELGAHADQVARERGRHLAKGVYAAMLGPSYETPAEIRGLRSWGADVVGMSMVPEVIAARYAHMRVLAFAVVSNLAAGLSKEPLSDADVRVVVDAAAPGLATFVGEVLRQW